MDKLQFAQIAPMIFVIAVVVIYYLIARRKPKSKEAELYQSLIHDGCQHCGGVLGVVLTPPSNLMRLGCSDCRTEYDVDHSLHHGWRIK